MNPTANSTTNAPTNPTIDRGRRWIERLSDAPVRNAMGTTSVLTGNVKLSDDPATPPAFTLAVVSDPHSLMPRASNGELGLEQAWTLAACLQDFLAESARRHETPPILAIVDTPGQAFGSIEEGRCISAACAASVEAYAAARRAGHTVLTLVVGRAISGSFLAHGMQSDRILALAGEGVMMHAMSMESIARITRRSVAEVASSASSVLPMSYAIEDAHRLGIIDTLVQDTSPDDPSPADIATVKAALTEALHNPTSEHPDFTDNPHRQATEAVRLTLQKQWQAIDALAS
jgi:biotin-independent malonate decarboxylase gamma subunit